MVYFFLNLIKIDVGKNTRLTTKNRKDLQLTYKIEIDIIELSKVKKEYKKTSKIKRNRGNYISNPNNNEVREIKIFKF